MVSYFPIVTGSLTVLGNISVSGSITTSGSITISGSITSASFASTASYWSGSIVNAESASFVANAQTASYVLNAVSSSFATSASYWSGSIVNAESASFASTASFVALAQSASYVLNAVSSSFASTASFVALAQSASNAVSAVTASFANNLTVAGTLTAQTLVVQTITSSVDFVTGSTRFGSILANTHVFTGSMSVSGSTHSILGKLSIGTGSNYPETTFDVVGYNAFRENSSSAHSWFPYTNGSAYVSCRTGSSIYFREYHDSSYTTFMTITGSRVGIGTTTPSYKFETLGTSVITAAFGRSDYGASNVMLIAMNGYRDVYKQAIGVVRTGDYDKGDMIFCLNAAANSTVVSSSDEKMRITSAGNVGIGTSSPGTVGTETAIGGILNVYNAGNGKIYARGGGGGELGFEDTGAGSGDKIARWIYDGGVLSFQRINDAFTSIVSTPLTITSAGTVIKSNQPAFQAGRSASQTITSGVDTILQFNTVKYDVQSNFNTSTYRFTAPVAGRYQFNATVRFDNTTNSGYMRTYFTVNGSGASYSYGHVIAGTGGFSTSYQGMSISAVLSLSAGDYVMVQGGHTTQTDFHPESQFSGYLLG